ncbi:MAG: hypothetical protein AAF289_06640 [Cyanobacteria bacterium P01_A01_bin.135]
MTYPKPTTGIAEGSIAHGRSLNDETPTARRADHGKSLAQAYRELGGDPPAKIPRVVWLLENPDSPLALGGSISLRNHDYLHILLGRGFSPKDEAFVIGVTMGNDPCTRWWDYAIFKLAARFLYPHPYRFTQDHLRIFDQGVVLGRSLGVKSLNRFDFDRLDHLSVRALRWMVGIS